MTPVRWRSVICRAVIAVALFSLVGSVAVRQGYAPVSSALVTLSAALGWIFIALCAVWGWLIIRDQYAPRRSAFLLLVVLVLSGAAEAAGVATGYVFGAYRYDPSMGPGIHGVPWAIPLAWWGMLAPVHLAVAQASGACIGSRTSLRLMQAAWVGACMASWDLFLEPVMSASHPLLTRWTWLTASGSPPVLNGVSWFAVSLLIGWIIAPSADVIRRVPHDLDRLIWIQALFPAAMGFVFGLPVWWPLVVWLTVWTATALLRRRARDWYNQADTQAGTGG